MPTSGKEPEPFPYSEAFYTHCMTPQNVGILPVPDGYGAPTGICGDQMEITIRVRGGVISECLFMTNGCAHTIACGSVVTDLAKGRAVQDARSIEHRDVIRKLGGLPPDHEHCARLAVATLRAAIRDYLNNQKAPWKRLYRTGP